MKVLLNFIPNPSHQDENIQEKIDNYLKNLYITLKKDYKTKALRDSAVKAIQERKTYTHKVKRHMDQTEHETYVKKNNKIEESDSESELEKSVPVFSEDSESDSELDKSIHIISEDSESEKSIPVVSEDSESDSELDKSIHIISEDSDSEKSAPIISEDSESESEVEKPVPTIIEESESESSVEKPVPTIIEESESENEVEKPVSTIIEESESESDLEKSLMTNQLTNKKINSDSEEEISENESKKSLDTLSDEEKKLMNRLKQIESEKKKLQQKNGFLSGGNMYNSDDESDFSDISHRSYEKTYLIDSDSDEEVFVDNIKNMKNKNYLNKLTISELKNIMRNNDIKVTNNGSYLKKKDMVRNIIKNFK
jgi:hypothetical protein